LGITNGTTRRTYRLAIVATGEFGAANGGTVAAAQAVVTASVNAAQVFYDRELSVRFTLLTPFIYLDAATDPFDPTNESNGNSQPQYIYYRLKQLDNNGVFTYSKTILLHPNRKALIQVYPNPTTNMLTVEHTAGLSSFDIVNTLGQVVRVVNTVKSTTLTDINTTELVRGIYYIRVNSFETIRFVKL
jgi:hypothetical protein